MRFLTLVKATQDAEARAMSEKLVAPLATSHAERAKAGARLDATGLQPYSEGRRITYSGGHRSFIDGPFAETKELIAGCVVPDQPPIPAAGPAQAIGAREGCGAPSPSSASS